MSTVSKKDHHPTPWVRHAWGVTLTLLVLACIAVWDISLLWRYREGPLVLGSCLLTIFVLVLATRQLARLVAPPPARSFLMRHFARLDAVGVVFIVFLLLLLLLFHLGFERAGSDGRSYFVQVRSLVMDWDLDFANDEAVFGTREARQYAFGAPILWSPFFILGHVWLNALNLLGADLRVDGYYFPYQRAIGLGTLLYGFIGLVLIYRVLRRYVSKELACLSTLGLCGTSFLIWYLTVENSMVHGVSMFATTLFLFLWHRCRDVPTRVPWVWLGAAAGVMTMVRWQNSAFVVLPLGDLLWSSWRARSRGSRARLWAGSRDLVRFTGAAFAAFVPQLLFWKATYGSWVYLPVREHAFQSTWFPPYMTDVLFSSNPRAAVVDARHYRCTDWSCALCTPPWASRLGAGRWLPRAGLDQRGGRDLVGRLGLWRATLCELRARLRRRPGRPPGRGPATPAHCAARDVLCPAAI